MSVTCKSDPGISLQMLSHRQKQAVGSRRGSPLRLMTSVVGGLVAVEGQARMASMEPDLTSRSGGVRAATRELISVMAEIVNI